MRSRKNLLNQLINRKIIFRRPSKITTPTSKTKTKSIRLIVKMWVFLKMISKMAMLALALPQAILMLKTHLTNLTMAIPKKKTRITKVEARAAHSPVHLIEVVPEEDIRETLEIDVMIADSEIEEMLIQKLLHKSIFQNLRDPLVRVISKMLLNDLVRLEK